MGLLLARAGRLRAARRAWRRTLRAAGRRTPAAAAAWNNLANAFWLAGRRRRALCAYRVALRLDPSLAAAHRNLARAALRMGRPGQALRHWWAAARAGPGRGARASGLSACAAAPAASGSTWGWVGYLAMAALAALLWLLRGAAPEPGLRAAAASPTRFSPSRTLPAPPRPLPAPAGPIPVGAELPVVLEAEGVRLEVVPARLGLTAEGYHLDFHAAAHLAEQLDRVLGRAPAEPRVRVFPDGSVEVVPGRSGRRVDPQALASAIERAMLELPPGRVVTVPLEELPPAAGPQVVESLMRPRLLSRYTTRLPAGEGEGRASNIRLAARAVDGVVLAPGATWSFNREVGPRLPQAGYRPAPVLRRGARDVGVGGGVCQVSTTVYNAALLAGLRARVRSPHSTPVPYVAPGRDATVAYGVLDLVLENPLPYPVALSARLQGQRLAVAVWGPSGAVVPPLQMRTVVEWFQPAPEVEVVDENLAPGERRVEVPARPGYGASVWREWALYGPYRAREMVNFSVYAPWPGEVRVGPDEPASCTQDAGQGEECGSSR